MSEREKEDTLRFLRDQLREIAGGVEEKRAERERSGANTERKMKYEGSGFKPPRILKSNKSFESLGTARTGQATHRLLPNYISGATPRQDCVTARTKTTAVT